MVIADHVLVRDGATLNFRKHEIRVSAARRPMFEMLRIGVCGTDLQICRGIRPDGARVLGHEGVARMIGGAGSGGLVVFNPVNPDAQDVILGHSYDGLFRENFVPEEASTPECLLLSPRLPVDLAVLVEPLGAVLYGWELVTRRCFPEQVAVWGAGTTAVLAALVAELEGCQVHLIHARRERLAFLQHLGLFERCELQEEPNRPAGVAAAFLCLPREAAPAALHHAISSIRQGGIIDLLGGFGSGDRHPQTCDIDLGMVRRVNVAGRPQTEWRHAVRQDDGRTIWLTGHRGTSTAHLAAAQSLLLKYPERFSRVITHVLSLEAAARALPAMAQRRSAQLSPTEYIKVVIDPTLRGADTRAPEFTTTAGDLAASA